MTNSNLQDSCLAKSLLDIVIPTMWRPGSVAKTIANYASCDLVGQIIVIDNDASNRQDLPEAALAKTKIIDHGKNIFVNPAWNEGVSLCKSAIICIANDDIVIDNALFSLIVSLDWNAHQIDIIGLDLSACPDRTEILKINISTKTPLGVQFPSYGACMFMPRENYRNIPDEIKIWYGDDFLAHSNPNTFILKTPLVSGEMSSTIRSFDPHSEIHTIIRKDIAWANTNLLDISGQKDTLVELTHSPFVMDEPRTISLDLGCGTNPQNPFKAERVIGIDPQCSASNILSCWVGFERIPLDDSSVDFVTAFDFIEHIPRFALRDKPFNPFIDAMSEIWRVLKPNGTFFARTPAYPSAAAFQDPTHVNIITDQTVSYFAKRPCPDGTFIDPWGPPLGKRYGFIGDFILIKQWWDTTHLCWIMKAIK